MSGTIWDDGGGLETSTDLEIQILIVQGQIECKKCRMRQIMIGLLTDQLQFIRSQDDLESIFLQQYELNTIAYPQVIQLKDELRNLREYLAVISRPIGALPFFPRKGYIKQK